MMVTHSAQPYLAENRRLAGLLVGRQVAAVERLLEYPSEDEPRLEWGPAVITFADRGQLLVDCDESKSNIRLLDPIARAAMSWATYSGFDIREPVVVDDPDHPLCFLLQSPFARVEVVSRKPSPAPGLPDAFVMCGLRLTTESGRQVCVGTHLTDLVFAQIAFLLPDEVDDTLDYEPLAG